MQAVLDPASDQWSRGNRSFMLTGRLKTGVTPGAAQTELAVLAEGLHREHPREWTDVRGVGRRLTLLTESRIRIAPPEARGPAVAGSALLMVVVGLVLLVACANLAGPAAGPRRGAAAGNRDPAGAGRHAGPADSPVRHRERAGHLHRWGAGTPDHRVGDPAAGALPAADRSAGTARPSDGFPGGRLRDRDLALHRRAAGPGTLAAGLAAGAGARAQG